MKGRTHLPKLDRVRKTILYQILEGYESAYSMNRSVSRRRLYRRDDNTIVEFSKLNLSATAVKKALWKLESEGLIEKMSGEQKKMFLSERILFEINLRRAEPYRITEYGIFCILSGVEYPSKLLTSYWTSIVIQTLLAPYLTKHTIEHATPSLHFTIAQFVRESCQLTIDSLTEVNEQSKEKTLSIELEKELLMHAKLFAMRCVLTHTVMGNPILLQTLMSDWKFRRFVGSVISELRRRDEQFSTKKR